VFYVCKGQINIFYLLPEYLLLVGACSTHGIDEKAHGILVAKSVRRRQLGKPRRMWEDNIKMYLRKIGFAVWIELIWPRVGTVGGLL
jgi:hypothetical protein